MELIPAAVAVDYLRAAGPAQIKQTLDRLDLVTVAEDQDQFGAAFLAQCWSGLRILVRAIQSQAETDPTWGDNVASAAFAAEAFAALGLSHEWESTAAYVRSRWSLHGDDATLLPSSGSITAEADDFSAIIDEMRMQDLVEPPLIPASQADMIDADRFHRTWVLGLLLGFEGTALVPDPVRRQALIDTAGKVQLPSGAFYPDRVPWVTARIVLGLVSCGETSATSVVVDSACRWLRSRRPAGPYSFGVWRPGTGAWNTDLQTTALVLLALGRAGIDPSDRAVATGISFLRDARPDWYRPGKEIDCAQAVEAALVMGGSWRDFSGEIRDLLLWAQDADAWASVSRKASEVHDESSKVPAVANSLVGIIWATVRAELPILFEGVAGNAQNSSGRTADRLPDWHHGLVRALGRLQEVCEQHVRDREQAVGRGRNSEEVRAALKLWRGRLASAEGLEAELSDGSARTAEEWEVLLIQASELGQAVMGSAWIDVV